MSITVIINCKFALPAGVTADDNAVSVLANTIGGEYNFAGALM